MSQPYHPIDPRAREEIIRRKAYYEQKLQECEQYFHAIESLASFLAEPLSPEDPSNEETENASVSPHTSDISGDVSLPSQHRRKEDLYDEEMRRLLSQVKVASKQATYQHMHRTLRGNTSIGAIESYLKRAVLRGVIVRLRRGEYVLPSQTD